MLQQIIVYIFSNFIQQFLGVLTSFSTRRFIPPADFGIWVTITLILGYCSYSSLGIFSAIYKEVPYYVGKKDLKAVNNIKNMSGTFIVSVGLIISVILFVLSCFMNVAPPLKIGLKVVALMLFPTLIFSFFITLLRAYNEFVSISKIVLVNSVLIFMSYIAFSFRWHLYGLYLAAIFSLVCVVIYTIISKRDILKFKFITSFKEFKNIFFLLKIGISLQVVGFFYTVLLTMERWLIIKKLGFSQLGYYSIAIMFFEGIGQLSLLVGHITFSKIQNLYGEMGKTEAFDVDAKKYVSKFTLYIAYTVPIAIGLIYIWGNFLISKFIPKYIPGIESMNILVIGALFIGLSHFSNNFLLTLNKYLLTIPLLVILSLIILVSALFFIHMGLGITGAAIAATIGHFLFFIGISWMALKNIHKMPELARFYLHIAATLIYYGFIIFLCTRIKFENVFITLLFQTFILFTCASPVLVKFNRESGFMRKILEIRRR